MRIAGEKTIFGEDIKSMEQFIEDICDRVNSVFGKVEEFEDEKMQLGIVLGFMAGLYLIILVFSTGLLIFGYKGGEYITLEIFFTIVGIIGISCAIAGFYYIFQSKKSV